MHGAEGGGAGRGLVIGAPRSGAGKSTVTMALLAALRRRGLRVAAAKSGPDYIDPAFHAAACGRPSPNLDSWAMPAALLDEVAADAAADRDVLLVESAMGLFDGAGPIPGRQGSAADLAARFGWPVLLVLDVSGQSQSAAAVARGFATHHPAVRVAGVVLNRVGSERHRLGAAGAIGAIGLPVLGALPRDPGIALPERHLGLVQARELGTLPALLERLADLAEAHLDLDALLSAAAGVPRQAPAPAPAPVHAPAPPALALPPPGQRIAVAEDAAFSFLYPHVVAGWRAAGATLHPFSPLADAPPPPDCDACWLPGGYPELHAGRLAAATGFLGGLRRFAERHAVHGECGGYMVLGAGLEDAEGRRHAMAGLLGHATSFAKRKMHLGYREARLLADGVLGPAGAVLRGHEFHYARVTEPGGDAPLAELADAGGQPLGPAGGRRGLVSGSFFHAIARQDR
ncbi:cobyrinate a,c-diamide synthase [Roseomonas sp. M0104]|uniref:Cobyrinate a,c-diamide synthase n=1 Tax=Teichococcus coralli TaxID=2545983 RepID=A0A845BAD9_9PROT|nr:cobyrinate a,c-diamide synthase [Pseudoroseomonas coralli]MXP64141.1 cobyrinate a,c-diamide synthase [Pseudoroseomonas coralli]